MIKKEELLLISEALRGNGNAEDGALAIVYRELGHENAKEKLRPCPVALVGNFEKLMFTPDQQFVVSFVYRGFSGFAIMTLDELQDMTETFRKAVYPRDVYLGNEYLYDRFLGLLELERCFTAWSIPEGWEKPSNFPSYARVGYFPDWDSGEFDDD